MMPPPCKKSWHPADDISIVPGITALSDMLADQFAGTDSGIAEENIQSDCVVWC